MEMLFHPSIEVGGAGVGENELLVHKGVGWKKEGGGRVSIRPECLVFE